MASLMEALSHPQNHCATCSVFLGPDDAFHEINWKLRFKIFTATGFQMQVHEDERMCNNCHQCIRAAEELRSQMQEAELQLREMQLGRNRNKMEIKRMSICSICLNQYPNAVKGTLMCVLQQSPILEKWMIRWCAKKNSDSYFPTEICRVCLAKIRQCYEWRCGCDASSAFLNDQYRDHEADSKEFPQCKGTRLEAGYSSMLAADSTLMKSEDCCSLFEDVGKLKSKAILDSPRSQQFQCRKCSKRFSNKTSFEEHMESKHDGK